MEDLAESFLAAAGRLDLGMYHVYGTGLNEQLNEVFQNQQAEFVKLTAVDRGPMRSPAASPLMDATLS